MVWTWEDSPVDSGKTLEGTQAFRSQRNWFFWQLEKRINKLGTVWVQTLKRTVSTSFKEAGHKVWAVIIPLFICLTVTEHQRHAGYCTEQSTTFTLCFVAQGLSEDEALQLPVHQPPWVMAGTLALVTVLAKSLPEARERGGMRWGRRSCGKEWRTVCELMFVGWGGEGEHNHSIARWNFKTFIYRTW